MRFEDNFSPFRRDVNKDNQNGNSAEWSGRHWPKEFRERRPFSVRLLSELSTTKLVGSFKVDAASNREKPIEMAAKQRRFIDGQLFACRY